MYASNAYKRFEKSANTQGVSKVGLVISLYNGAIEEFQKCRYFISNPKMEDAVAKKFDCMAWGNKIIQEGLVPSVIDKYNKELADMLRFNYNYVMSRIVIGCSRNDVQIVDECIGILNELKGAWVDVEKQLQTS